MQFKCLFYYYLRLDRFINDWILILKGLIYQDRIFILNFNDKVTAMHLIMSASYNVRIIKNMLQRYLRSINSEKYNNKMHINKQQCFDLTLADMDIGVYQPLHQRVVATFQNMQADIMKIERNNRYKQGVKEVELKYQTRAQNAIVSWYNQEFQCNIYLTNDKPNLQQKTSYGVDILFCSSIVSLCSYAVMAFSQPNDAVLIMTPVYASYSLIINKLNRKAVQTKLAYLERKDGLAGNFFFNEQNMQKVIKAEGVKILLLSHPHNPSGRVWKEEEVKSMVRICKKYDVVIVSDEILADLTLMSRGIKFYSLAREFPNYSKIIIANSISKAFNYSSLQGGYAFTADRHLYQRINQVMSNTFGEHVDQLGVCAIVECLTSEGRAWLSIIRQILHSNYLKLLTFKHNQAPLMEIGFLQAAYLVYLDLSKYFVNAKQMKKMMEDQHIYMMELGSNYMPEKQGTLLVRICIACQQDHFDRFMIKLGRILKQANKESPKL